MRFRKCQQAGLYSIIREILRIIRAAVVMTRGVGDNGTPEEGVIIGELVINAA